MCPSWEFIKFPHLNRNKKPLRPTPFRNQKSSNTSNLALLWSVDLAPGCRGSSSARVGVGPRGLGRQSVVLSVCNWACLSCQVTNQSGVQGLFQDVRPMQLGHVECRRRGTRVARSREALTGNGRGGHVQRGRALLVVLAIALLV